VRWSDIPFDPGTRTLRKFAGLWLCLFSLMALWQEFGRERHTIAAILAILALTVGPIGLVSPRLVRPIYVGLIVFTFPIGWTVSQIILLIIFFLIFTPVALIFRMLGRDVLHRGWNSGRGSYWTPKPSSNDPRSYFRQF
jgi:hypothetical protein